MSTQSWSSGSKRVWRVGGALVGSALLLGGAVSGCVIEERKFDAEYAQELGLDDDRTSDDERDETSETDAGEGPAGPSEECTTYCDRVMTNCVEELAVYASTDACLATCALLRSEPLDEDDTNTVACRSQQAQLARTTGEPNVHCPAASPGGQSHLSRQDCGTNCESYCLLQPLVCSGTDERIFEQEECLRQCSALRDDGNFDVELHHDANNVQCRLVHLSSGALNSAAAESHCWHASIAPQIGSPCGFPKDATPLCEDYCRVVAVACTDERAVYSDESQCLAACAAFPEGTGDDRIENTVGCRQYHAYASLADPETHCKHASPAGDGHCGVDNCESYCQIAEFECPTLFGENYGSVEACLEACAQVPGAPPESGYDVVSAQSGNTVACRIYQSIEAGDDPERCGAVFGEAPCD